MRGRSALLSTTSFTGEIFASDDFKMSDAQATESKIQSTSAPTEDAVDVVRAARDRNAYLVFHLNMGRINALLRAGSAGIEKSQQDHTALRSRFDDAINAGTVEEIEEEEYAPKVERLDDRMVQLRLEEKEIRLIQVALAEYDASIIGGLLYNLHNVLCVAVWGAFEGYVQAALAEIFSANMHLLSSDKHLSVSEVIEAGDSLHSYLIAKEIDDVGRRSFGDIQKYLSSKLKLQFAKKHLPLMQDAYFLRNVIAHSAGFLREDQLKLVPKGVDAEKGELRISQEYLVAVVTCITNAVDDFNDQLNKKFKLASS